MDFETKELYAKPNETIRQHTDALLEQVKLLAKYGYITSNNLLSDLNAACEYHDSGKGNSRFQKRIKCHTKFDYNTEIPHNILSLYFVEKSKCIDYTSVCFAVLYHHYHHESPERTIMKNKELIQEILCELFGNADKYNALRRCRREIGNLFSLPLTDEKKKYAVLLKGLLHKCDYSASAHIQCEYKNDFLLQSIYSWKNEFNISYNELQSYCEQNRNENIIVTAPTGMGKTEAGLLWCGDNKCFYVLPLKTAINAMYDRISKLTADKEKVRVALIHSDMKSKYSELSEENPGGELDLEYCSRSKQMSLPITVCTPDQIFDFVLKYPGYEYKLATASYSKFIIDEIQMYSADLLAAIIYAIKLIYNMGGKFAILTATLPPFVRSELNKIFGEDVKNRDFSSFGKLRHNVKVQETTLDAEKICRIMNDIDDESVKKYLVVCNSIDIANEIYSDLSEALKGKAEVNLFHSRFIKKDRAEKENQILNASKDSTKKEVWVSTSVVEASLDIDFDILFTELSDLFSLFQRFGRVNRKGEKDFALTNTNCYVFTERQGNALRYHFTDDTIYELSKEAIKTKNGLISEEDKTSLIDEYLSAERIEKSDYYREYLSAMEELENKLDYLSDKNERLRSIDRVDVIPIEVYNDNEEKIRRAEAVIRDKNLSPSDRLKASEEIMQYTVSISKFRASSVKNGGSVNVGHNYIPIFASCSYSKDKGMIYFDEKSNKTG
ncbi:MAG: CRISPR-associated helicase Cas3', partial [Acutalibacteraceae bacterium]